MRHDSTLKSVHFAAFNFTINLSDYLAVTPNEAFASRGHPGGPFIPDNRNYILNNTSGASISWQANAAEPWVSVSPASGTIPGGGSNSVTVTFTSEINSFPEGIYTNSIAFSNLTTTISQNRAVVLDVFTTSEIHVSPMEGFVVTNMPGQVQKRTLSISNAATADGYLNFDIGLCQTGYEPATAPLVLENGTVSDCMVMEYTFSKPQMIKQGEYDYATIPGMEDYLRTGAPVVPVRPVPYVDPLWQKSDCDQNCYTGKSQASGVL